MFDIEKLNTSKLSNEGVKVRFVNPITNEEDKDAFVILHGYDSDFYNDNIKENIEDAVSTLTALNNKDWLKDVTTSELNDKKARMFFLACSDWGGFTIGKKKLEFNLENFLLVAKANSIFIETLETKIGERQTFLAKEQSE